MNALIAQLPGITAEEMAAFHRFCECCEDFDSGGYDVPKEMMKRLSRIGLVRSLGFGRYEATEFGVVVRETGAQNTPIAYEFWNPETGHAIVDYSEHTYVGLLTAEKGYVKKPLYAGPAQ